MSSLGWKFTTGISSPVYECVILNLAEPNHKPETRSTTNRKWSIQNQNSKYEVIEPSRYSSAYTNVYTGMTSIENVHIYIYFNYVIILND